ncbi:hypothetical protein ACJ72_06846 [Emergomyces africanus]|uniref:Uncharacterized protein n=1 Tax=Emergomyces africanus TaxID=1955775 RepID=A0A1B7NPT4_9EURO|nr:hypothetical protein ACJ72_06846 [Emergomyces africanus]
MESTSQGSPADAENIQHACSTQSLTQSPCASPQHNPSSTRGSAPNLPQGDSRDQVPLKLPTPKPWAWTCHECDETYNFEATTRCLYDGHYFCSRVLKNRNSPPRHNRNQNWEKCTNIFDAVGWKAMKAWQQEMRRANGKEKQREPDCISDCISPRDCVNRTAVSATTTLFEYPTSHAVFSHRSADLNQQIDLDEVENSFRVGSKRVRLEAADAPSEASPAKRRKLTHENISYTTKRLCSTNMTNISDGILESSPLLIGSPLRVTHCYQTTFITRIEYVEI